MSASGISYLILAALAYGGAISAAQSSNAISSPEVTVQKYCLGCHNSKLKAPKIAFDTQDLHKAGDHSVEWEKVVKKLRTRSMPPAGLPRPDEAAYSSLLSSITTSLDTASAANPNPGRNDTFRRLNRNEYHNAIRDLLSLDVDVTSLLPSDESSHGFDNVTVGDLSPTLLRDI